MDEPRLRGGELYKYQELEERLKALKMLVIWWWAPKNAKAVTERFMEWKAKGKYEVLYPISTMIGMNKAFMVAEADDMAEVQKDIAQWTDLCTFKFIPIMDSSEAIAVSRQ